MPAARCPSCKRVVRVPDRHGKFRCPECGEAVRPEEESVPVVAPRRRRVNLVWVGLAAGGGAALLVALTLGTILLVVGTGKAPQEPVSRDEFRAKVMGKPAATVVRLFGKPTTTGVSRGPADANDLKYEGRWYYFDRRLTVDPVTGKVDRSVSLEFRDGVVREVSF